MLRHDFRRVYSCSYDELRNEEEVLDLIATLPDGSLTISKMYPARSWEKWQHSLANIQDQLFMLLCHMPKGVEAPHVERPQDIINRQRAKAQSRKVSEQLNNQQWKEV